MPQQARDSYLVTEVMTATPQKLHLMLIEGAMRLVHRALQHWAAREEVQAVEALSRAQEIVGEILAGFDREADPSLVNRVAAIYAFVLRSLVEASFERDPKKVAGVLRVLESERQTWRQLCEQTAGQPPVSRPTPSPAAHCAFPSGVTESLSSAPQSGQFSFEA
jgi:flagellar secretion chaperone FliS